MTSCIQFLSWHMYLNLLESLEVARPGFRKFDSKYYIEGIKNAFPISQLHNANFPHNLVPRLFPLRAARRVVERAWVRGCFPPTPFGCPNTKFPITRNNFFSPPPPDGRNFLRGGVWIFSAGTTQSYMTIVILCKWARQFYSSREHVGLIHKFACYRPLS